MTHTTQIEPSISVNTEPSQKLSRPYGAALTVIAVAAALSACGGGNQVSTSASAEEVSDEWFDDGTPPTQAQAAAFLAQAGFGGNMADVDEVVALGFEGWINKQVSMPLGVGHVSWMVKRGIGELHYGEWAKPMWNAFAAYPDQLRQRMVYALSQIFVVSARGFTTLRALKWTPILGQVFKWDTV